MGETPTFLDHEQVPLERARVVLLPLPYDGTASFMKGTAAGPGAILAASAQLETYEEERGWEPTAALALHTLPPVDARAGEGPGDYLARVEAALSAVPENAFVVGLGGEHTVSGPLIRRALPEGGTVIHIDAHPDLRDKLDGEPLSHGCVMRRVAEEGRNLVQIALGCNTAEEAAFARAHGGIEQFFAFSLETSDGFARLLRRLGELAGDAYLSIDSDGLCTSIVPGTGTPVPGGLTWRELMAVLRAVWGNPRLRVRGMDVVEIRPLPDSPLSEFTAAKVVQKCLSFGFGEKARQPG